MWLDKWGSYGNVKGLKYCKEFGGGPYKKGIVCKHDLREAEYGKYSLYKLHSYCLVTIWWDQSIHWLIGTNASLTTYFVVY